MRLGSIFLEAKVRLQRKWGEGQDPLNQNDIMNL